jgi:hypothetical protein
MSGKEYFDMLINFKCPHCQTALQVGSDFAGKTGVCPKCKKEVTVPAQSTGTHTGKTDAAKKE